MGLKSALHTPPPTPLHGHRRLRVPPAPPLTTASLSLLSLSLSLFLSPLSANAQECTAQGNVAIFMVYQAENPDSVFLSEDGCLAGGGRGSGCCSGAQCRVCEPNQVTSTSGQQMNWNSCVCEPCPPGSVQFREGSQECVQCPAGWYQPFQGRTECIQCPTGTFNPRVGRVEECVVCPPGTYSKSENRAYREATTKLYRGTTTTFDQSKGAISCTNCKAVHDRCAVPDEIENGTLASGTYQPKSGGKNAEECLPCPSGTFSTSGAAGCTQCPAGTYQPYVGMAGAKSCLPCQAGKCSDSPGSMDCYQCCPVSNLACDAFFKRARGFYATQQWYSNEGETGRVPTDKYDEFLVDLCARGCEMFGVVNWCVTNECPRGNAAAAAASSAGVMR